VVVTDAAIMAALVRSRKSNLPIAGITISHADFVDGVQELPLVH
jgi:hypothetical protein